MGAQKGVVVGPTGEEIFVDKYGGVKVHFEWDTSGIGYERSSCWIPVAQPPGEHPDLMYIPRIGEEVVVSFLDGDPNRPFIVGRLHNDRDMPPWNLPSEARRLPELVVHSHRRAVSEDLRKCFISYSSKDQQFASQLHRDLERAGIGCWFAPEDLIR
jgi:uncharacterized protein involved in type VI secretion and phage assembly